MQNLGIAGFSGYVEHTGTRSRSQLIHQAKTEQNKFGSCMVRPGKRICISTTDIDRDGNG